LGLLQKLLDLFPILHLEELLSGSFLLGIQLGLGGNYLRFRVVEMGEGETDEVEIKLQLLQEACFVGWLVGTGILVDHKGDFLR
jgi:hypothetical protein